MKNSSLPTARSKAKGWQPTLSQIAERADSLWHRDECPLGQELHYWMEARQQLQRERAQRMHREIPSARSNRKKTQPGPPG